jgi:hypothetical protein
MTTVVGNIAVFTGFGSEHCGVWISKFFEHEYWLAGHVLAGVPAVRDDDAEQDLVGVLAERDVEVEFHRGDLRYVAVARKSPKVLGARLEGEAKVLVMAYH